MNIFLDIDNNIKLGDFGLATKSDHSNITKIDEMSTNQNNEKKQLPKK